MDGFDAALRQLADHGERLAVQDAREAEHFRAIAARLAELGTVVTGLGETARDQAGILAGLQGLDEQVATLATRLAELLPGGDGEVRVYRPPPAPCWWKLRGQARDEAVAKLASWVEQVYRPGYASSPPPWPRAGRSTRSASMRWTSRPSSGACCTCRTGARQGRYPPRPSCRPGSCPRWPSR